MKIKLLRDPAPKEIRHIFVKIFEFEEYGDFKEECKEDLLRCLKVLEESGNEATPIDGFEYLVPTDGDGCLMQEFWKYLNYIRKVGIIEFEFDKVTWHK